MVHRTKSLSTVVPIPTRSDTSKFRLITMCFAAIIISVHISEYGPLIPFIRADLRISDSQVGLLTTLYFVGTTLANIPGGMLTDRFGSRRVLYWSTVLVTLGTFALPLLPNFPWLLLWRVIIGLGVGGVTAGARPTAQSNRSDHLEQGLFGGFLQVGTGLSLLFAPHLALWLNWRGAMLFWGFLGLFLCLLALHLREQDEELHIPQRSLNEVLRVPIIWTLGLAQMATYALSNTIAAWVALYLVYQHFFSLTVAATVGACVLCIGILARPIGGWLLVRNVATAQTLIRIGIVLGCGGLGILALPVHWLFLTFVGLGAVAVGTTLPYAAIYSTASQVGLRSGIGSATAQGALNVIAAPMLLFGSPMIGTLLEVSGGFSIAFAILSCIGLLALGALVLSIRTATHASREQSRERVSLRQASEDKIDRTRPTTETLSARTLTLHRTPHTTGLLHAESLAASRKQMRSRLIARKREQMLNI